MGIGRNSQMDPSSVLEQWATYHSFQHEIHSMTSANSWFNESQSISETARWRKDGFAFDWNPSRHSSRSRRQINPRNHNPSAFLSSMDILKQLAPLYRKHENVSLQDLDETEFFYTDRSLHFCICRHCLHDRIASSCVSYSELTSSLSSSMRLDRSNLHA